MVCRMHIHQLNVSQKKSLTCEAILFLCSDKGRVFICLVDCVTWYMFSVYPSRASMKWQNVACYFSNQLLILILTWESRNLLFMPHHILSNKSIDGGNTGLVFLLLLFYSYSFHFQPEILNFGCLLHQSYIWLTGITPLGIFATSSRLLKW